MRSLCSARAWRAIAALALAVLLPLSGPGTGLPEARGDEDAYQAFRASALGALREAELRSRSEKPESAVPYARRALLFLEQAEAQKPGDADVAFLSVQGAVFAGDRKVAESWLERLRQRLPNGDREPFFLYARALVEARLDHHGAQALEDLDTMAKTAPTVFARRRELLAYTVLLDEGERLLDTNHADRAVESYQEALKRAVRLRDVEKQWYARGRIGIVLGVLGRSEEAAGVFGRLAAEDPGNPAWIWWLARALESAGKPLAAADAFERFAVRMDARRGERLPLPEMADARVWEARALEKAASEATDERRPALLERARAALVADRAGRPDSVRTLYALAELDYRKLGRPYEAVDLLRHVLELDTACEAPIRLLVEIVRESPVPPDADAAAWARDVETWTASLRDGADARRREREARRARSPSGDDGCP